MLPKWHVLFGALFSIFLYYLFDLTLVQLLLIFSSSVLVDVDHYLYYLYAKKDINLKNAYKIFAEGMKKWVNLTIEEREKNKRSIFLFHGIEFWTVLAILSFINPIFLWILIGIIFHMILDFAEMIYYKEPFYSKFSQIFVFITNKKKISFFDV